MEYLILLAWILVGALTYLAVIKYEKGFIDVGTVLIGLFVGLCGGFIFFAVIVLLYTWFWIVKVIEKNKDFFSKKIL